MNAQASLLIVFLAFCLEALTQPCIKEVSSPISQDQLAPGWKTLAKDDLFPTHLVYDFDGDSIVDMAGLFTGFHSGITIYRDFQGKLKTAYDQPFDESCYNKKKQFTVVMNYVPKGKVIKNIETGEKITLSQHSVEVCNLNGSAYVITWVNGAFDTIPIRKASR